MRLHWQILVALVAGSLVGGLFQATLEADPWIGARFDDAPGGGAVVALERDGPAAEAGIASDAVIVRIIRQRGDPARERTVAVAAADDVRAVLAGCAQGEVLWLGLRGGTEPQAVAVTMNPDSARARWIAPFAFVADLFMALLKMLIVPVILTSIITGVAGAGSGRDLRRLGLKTFAYYILTSLLAICAGLALVNTIRPGEGATLGLSPNAAFEDVAHQSFLDVIRRMIPENVFSALAVNGRMLEVIFFALLFGYFITRTAEPHRGRMREFFGAAFEVMMKMAVFVLGLIPYGVFALLVKVLGETGFGLFRPLGLYMITVTAGLVIHSCVTLPLILRLVGRISPGRWARAMSPALMTAFSTSSSALTLPVTMESVERRGGVSNRVTSFVLPLGATINMDGTALYECVGVIFLAQYYAGAAGYVLTFGDQLLVVLMALMASIGAAGIPSAGLVMMLTILAALRLPLEGAALLLAVDRPLDMLRTMVNVWSDSCGASLVARTEGETPLAAPG